MVSSAKSEKLGLSLWEAGDRPERLDFRQDNEKLESLVGGHIANQLLHLTAEEKEFLQRSYWTITYVGTGARWQTIYGQTRLPQLVMVLCESRPPVLIDSEGKVTAYTDFWFKPGSASSKPTYGGGAVLVDAGQKYIAFQNQTGDSFNRNLNEKGQYYIALCFGALY